MSHLSRIGRLLIVALAAAIPSVNATPIVVLAAAESAADDEASATGWEEGLWKSPPVPPQLQREFEAHDPYALAIGVRIRTDCSIRYRWVGNGRVYCFNSLTSKAFFIRRPEHYIRTAEAFARTHGLTDNE
ncbi:MAG: hypothetical protein AAFX85_13065 [Pseudomonadota bacterium]